MAALFNSILEFSEASSPAPPSSASSGFSSEDSLHCDISGGYSIEQFVEYVRNRGHSELVAEYVEIKLREADGSFNHARFVPPSKCLSPLLILKIT